MKHIFIEKKAGFDTGRKRMQERLETEIGKAISEFRLLHLYYREADFEEAEIEQVFSEPLMDDVHVDLKVDGYDLVLRIEFLPGQFDQRAYWANACLQVLGIDKAVRCGVVYLFRGVNEEDAETIRNYLINPVESMEIPWGEDPSLKVRKEEDPSWMQPDYDLESSAFLDQYGLAMSKEDLQFIKDHYGKERLPNWTELKMIDTYWSDHCRHTTFLTELEEVDLSDFNIPAGLEFYEQYREERTRLSQKPMSLMDLATFSARRFQASGYSDVEVSAEINACSIKRKVGGEDALILFKNETHNHPTEIEPFGGAATCLGGAIRDPLSGRAYVYQSMRVTGSSDPYHEEKIPSKLPAKTITQVAAQGYSSYGNQIGVCTGHVREYYHPGFRAKRMEAGFVVGAAKASHVRREQPRPGDLLLLVGGPTGRDGIGGASGSSRSHSEEVVTLSGGEVQKGNAPEERKLQRFFRREDIGPKIRRCNDFGAGGVSVAFGEIAEGLEVHLERVPVKYEDIFPWEIAISESQERMALVIDAGDLELFMQRAEEDNLRCTLVGEVKDHRRFQMYYNGKLLVDLDRDFLNASGAPRKSGIQAEGVDLNAEVERLPESLLYASQQGLVEHFDASIGGWNLLNPYGGKTRRSFVEGMVSLIPVGDNQETVSIASHGYDPYISSWSPYHGGEYAVMASLAKNLVLGGDIEGQRFTFQEYFEGLGHDRQRWAKPFLALLGANRVLHHFGLPAIGGKDSMSGSFYYDEGEIHVPPTLISFSLNTAHHSKVLGTDFKEEASSLGFFPAYFNEDQSLDLVKTEASYREFLKLRDEGKVLAASVVEESFAKTLINMSLGNDLGFDVTEPKESKLGIVAQIKGDIENTLGKLTARGYRINGESIHWDDKGLERIFPTKMSTGGDYPLHEEKLPRVAGRDNIKVLIPVFPGTNSEEDMTRSFERAGAQVHNLIFRNLHGVEDSLKELAKALDDCDILALAGGFSAADEPEGSAKFIASVFRNQQVQEAFHRLLDRGGHVIGICNGFQALVKLGVFEGGRILDPSEIRIGLTYNEIGRHQAQYVETRVHSNASGWLKLAPLGAVQCVPVSHGEGRFFATEEVYEKLLQKGQIASRYLDNPNGSMMDVEGIISENGQIFGKMAHSERLGAPIKNIDTGCDLKIFESVVRHLKGEI